MVLGETPKNTIDISQTAFIKYYNVRSRPYLEIKKLQMGISRIYFDLFWILLVLLNSTLVRGSRQRTKSIF